MHFFPNFVIAPQQQTIAAIYSHRIAKTYTNPIDLTILPILINLQMLAADNAGLFQPDGHYGGMGGLAAA